MAEQPSWQNRLDALALTEDEKNEAEVLILGFTTVEERVLFLRGSAAEATSRVRTLLNSQPGENSFQPCMAK